MTNLDQVHEKLEGGHSTASQPQDTEQPKYYVPPHPFQTVPYYPQSPHPSLSTAAIFSQLDVETLFYVFYLLPGTYNRTETTVMAMPCEISYIVPAPL